MGWYSIKIAPSFRGQAVLMADFATPPLGRDQLVLFPEKLDDIIASDHPVRLLDDILERESSR